LYKHVDGLPEVLSSLALLGYAGIAAAMAPPDRGSPEQHLIAIGRSVRTWALEHPGLYAAATPTHVGGTPDVHRAGAALTENLLAAARAVVGPGERSVHAARALRALVSGFVALEAEGAFGLEVDAEASFDQALEALVAGLGIRARAR
jgi:hypothetical protein